MLTLINVVSPLSLLAVMVTPLPMLVRYDSRVIITAINIYRRDGEAALNVMALAVTMAHTPRGAFVDAAAFSSRGCN